VQSADRLRAPADLQHGVDRAHRARPAPTSRTGPLRSGRSQLHGQRAPRSTRYHRACSSTTRRSRPLRPRSPSRPPSHTRLIPRPTGRR
jgi:hypothetical protein